jgi:hypothetical protein
MATVKPFENHDILYSITLSVIPESARGGYPESRKKID